MVQARTITDFSVVIGSTIDIDEYVDFEAMTELVYSGTFNAANTYSLNADIDFTGETLSPIIGFVGTFNGNGFRLSNHDNTHFFNILNTGASIDGVIFHNFSAPASRGITPTIAGSASVTNCVCCGTFVTGAGTFAEFISTSVVFENNRALLSGSSRLLGGRTAGISSRSSGSVRRCFFAGTSGVMIASSFHAGSIIGEGDIGGENACNFNGYILGTTDTGGLVGEVDDTPNGCTGLYACGSFDVITNGANDFSGRIIGNRAGGNILETYYYGSGDVVSYGSRVNQAGQAINSATVFSERKPSIQGSNYLSSDVVVGPGLKGSDTSVWAGGSFAGPDIFKNVPHFVPVESFAMIHDPIGTIQLHLVNKTDYPVFMKFNFDDPSVSFTVLDTEYREITGYEAKIVSRHHILTNATETLTNPSGLDYYVNATPSEFDALVEPETIVGTPAKDVVDFSVHVGNITVGDFTDLSAMHRLNYTGLFHPSNNYYQTADIQYPDPSTIVSTNFIQSFEGVYDGNGFRILDTATTGQPFRLSQRATMQNITAHNINHSNTFSLFSSHTAGSIIRHCKVTGDIVSSGPALVGNTNLLGIFDDCQVLASGNSFQLNQGVAVEQAHSVRRLFVATQPGHAMNSTSDIGGVFRIANSNVSKIGCNMRSTIASSRDNIGLVMAESNSTLNNQPASKGFYGCGKTLMLGTDASMRTNGVTGEGTLNEFFYANSGDVIMQSNFLTQPVPAGRGTAFSDFTGTFFDQAQNNTPTLDSDVNANAGGLYAFDATLWTAPWDVSSHLDYPSMLIEVPHFIPLPDDEVINDVMCTIQLFADSDDGYASFFKIGGDRYETDYHVDLITRDGLPAVVDGSWVLQFVFPFDVESSKNIIFRGTTLSSVDSKTFVIGGIPFVPFPETAQSTIEAKNVTDFAARIDDIITMNDLADFEAVVGVTEFHPRNVFNMTADVDLASITDVSIFQNFEGTFDGKFYRIRNRTNTIFTMRNSRTTSCLIKDVIFQNLFGGAPVLHMYGTGKITNCVSCGIFTNVLCGLVHDFRDLSSAENCYVLISGNSVMDAGVSSSASLGVIGLSKSFFSGSSGVLIQNGTTDTGCIGRSLTLGGNIGVNFLGDILPTSGDPDIGGLVGEARNNNGLGYYVTGDFTMQGSPFAERLLVGGVNFDECYYANRGDITSGEFNIRFGLTGSSNRFLSTAFADFVGTYNGVQITENTHNPRNSSAGVYSRAPEVWWSPWDFDTTRPSMLKETPHFIPIESSEQHTDILGDITIELENITLYPIFVRVEYINETDMSIDFFSRRYEELTTGVSAEIVFPLSVTKTVYHNSSVVTSVDNLTYAFGAPLGTLVPGFGDAPRASTITDFSVFIDDPIIIDTPEDMRAMYRGNYAGEFNASNTYMVTSDIDLYEENFVVADHQILTFRGTFDGGGHRIMNHGGQLFSRFASGSTLKNVVFMDFMGPVIVISGGYNAMNCVFMSGSMTGNQSSVFGAQSVHIPSTMSNMKAFIHGNVNFSGPALLGSANMASEMFLATTSTVTHNVGFNSGVLCNNGMFGLNVGCNVNGTSRSNQSAIILGRGSLSGIDSGGFYASGTLEMTHTANNSNVSHLIQERASSSHRPQKSGCYTAMTGGITRDFGNALTPITTYLRDAAPFSTAFSDFVPGVTVDETLGGGVYTRDNSVWATPWLFEDHLDHPAMLKGLAHYLVVESGDPINDILGEVSVISDTYPLFLEIEYSENDDGSDRFTYKVLDTTYTENTEAVVLVTYPFDVQPTTQIWNNGEEITSFNNRSYTVGSPLFASRLSPISIEVSWIEVSGATSYRLTSREAGTNTERVQIFATRNTRGFARNLSPNTQYIFSLFTVSGAVATLQYTVSATTLESNASNYGELLNSIEDTDTGVFDFTQLSSADRGVVSEFIEDLFPQGSRLRVELTGRSVGSTVVHRGGSVAVADSDAVLTPFNTTDMGQFIEITSEDSTSLRLDYDETSNEFDIGGETFGVGDSFVFDGKKVRIFEF